MNPHYLKFRNIDLYFNCYKKRPTSNNLNNLYNELDYIILNVANGIGKAFRRNYPDDFEDILQQIRLEVFQTLSNICSISIDGEQLQKILVKVIIYAFIDNYKKFKKDKHKFISKADLALNDNLEQFNMIPLEKITGDSGAIVPTTEQRPLPRLAEIFHRPNQEIEVYLSDLPRAVKESVVINNRYKEHEPIVLFCFDAILSNRAPSSTIISKIWKVNNPIFWIDYTEVLIRMAIFEKLNENKTVSLI